MKNLLTLLFLLTAFLSNAQQNNLNKITGLESTTASVAYSLRQLSTSYTDPLVRIKVGASFYDVYPDASTTKFSLNSKISAPISTYNAAVAAASVNALSTIVSGSTDATVAIWYDQSGNGVHVLSSNPNAKIITAGSINTIFGQPTIYFSGSTSALGSSSTVDYSALSGATVNAVTQNIATTSGYAGIIGAANAGTYPGYNISYTSGVGYQSDGDGCGYRTSVNSTDPKIVTNIFINNTTNLSKIYVNNELKTNVAVTSGTCALSNTSGSKIFIGVSRGFGSASTFIGNISEAIIFPGQLSDAVRNPLETNQSQTYLGPAVTIASSASGAVCAGTSVTFTATAYNFSSTPSYQWYKNSVAINGETGASYTTSTLANADQIYAIASAVTSNSLTATITAGPSAVVTVSGDGCINKTTLSTPAGQTSYAWYKDNAPISGAISNTYSPTTAGEYKVQVTSGTCFTMSAATTISVCGVTADGRMSVLSSSTTLVSREGAINNRNGVDERGLILTNSVTPVTTGLMLYLDATKSASYGGTGTTWNDISGELPAGSATLVGNPPFSSGSFTFGNNMYASTSKTYTVSNQLTLIAWVNPSQTQGSYTGVIVRRTDPSFLSGATGMFLSGNILHYDWDNNQWSWRSNITVPTNQWSMIVLSVKESVLTVYLCNASGIYSESRGTGHGSLTSKGATNFHIGYDPYDAGGRAFRGKMGTAMVYSVGLSTEDITTIFNAQKAAFGIN